MDWVHNRRYWFHSDCRWIRLDSHNENRLFRRHKFRYFDSSHCETNDRQRWMNESGSGQTKTTTTKNEDSIKMRLISQFEMTKKSEMSEWMMITFYSRPHWFHSEILRSRRDTCTSSLVRPSRLVRMTKTPLCGRLRARWMNGCGDHRRLPPLPARLHPAERSKKRRRRSSEHRFRR